jgi:hypothetical protein
MKKTSLFRMNITTILSLIVLITLVLAIARQISERPKNHEKIYLLPDSFGIPYATHGQGHS